MVVCSAASTPATDLTLIVQSRIGHETRHVANPAGKIVIRDVKKLRWWLACRTIFVIVAFGFVEVLFVKVLVKCDIARIVTLHQRFQHKLARITRCAG